MNFAKRTMTLVGALTLSSAALAVDPRPPPLVLIDGSAHRFLGEDAAASLRAAQDGWDAGDPERALLALDDAAASMRAMARSGDSATGRKLLPVAALANAADDVERLADDVASGLGAAGETFEGQLVEPALVIARFDLELARLLCAQDRRAAGDALGDAAQGLAVAANGIGETSALIADPYVDDALSAERRLGTTRDRGVDMRAHVERLEGAIEDASEVASEVAMAEAR